MQKLEGKTFNVVQDNIEKLKELFPEVLTENKIDIEKLLLTLGEHVEKEKERYEFTWNGKTEAIQLAQKQTTGTLRPCKEESVNWDTTQNLYVEGDNLEVLRILQNSYRNKVKMIYIDPPYNTGRDFIYKDDFHDNVKSYKESMKENMKSNAETSGRYHTDWLNMIYPRLKIAKNLLKDDGVIFVSIDEHEENNLTLVLNEIFGEENKISKITWEKGRKNDSTFYSESVEYILVYAKNKLLASKFGKWRAKKPGYDEVMKKFNALKKRYNDNYQIEEEMKEYYRSLSDMHPAKELKHFFRVDDRGLYFGGDISSASTSIPDYDVIHPVTGKAVKKPTRGWGCTEPEMLKRIADNRVHFGPDESTIPLRKIYLLEAQDFVLTPVIYKDGRAATLTLKELLGDTYFENPKDHLVIKDLIEYVGCENEIILDFFSGSATTAHAIMQLNAEDGGMRKFIMVQLPELVDVKSKAHKAGYKNICEIGKERIRIAGKKILEENKNKEGITNLDFGFKVFHLDDTNLKLWDEESISLEKDLIDLINPVKEGRIQKDVVYEILLKYGIDLAVPIEETTIAGKTVYSVGLGYLLICLEQNLTLQQIEEMAKQQPARIVFYDEGFKDDTVRTNAQQILKRYGVEDIRVI